MKRKIILSTLSALAFALLFGSCATLSTKQVNAKWNDSNFWFALDPLLLTKATSNRIQTHISGKEDFDSLFLKSEVLIQSIENGIAGKYYKEDQINYELKQTVSQIDSLDPINSFSGHDIIRAEKSYITMLEKRQKLLNLIKQEKNNE